MVLVKARRPEKCLGGSVGWIGPMKVGGGGEGLNGRWD